MKFRFKARRVGFYAWYLLPTIRFGLYSDPKTGGGYLAFTFLKFDAVLSWVDVEAEETNTSAVRNIGLLVLALTVYLVIVGPA